MTTLERPAPAHLGETVQNVPVRWQQLGLVGMVVGPLLALVVGVLLAAGTTFGPTWTDGAIALAFYLVAGHGITVGYHRYFTHRSFAANRPLRVALAVAGSMGVQGSVTSWVAAHRRHHAHSDQAEDPHSPWRFGTGPWALTKGLLWAHTGWFFSSTGTNYHHFVPDLLADRDIRRVDALFPLLAVLSIFGPGLIGGLVTWSFTGALSALLWAGVIRMMVLHHVTWSVNSICHVFGSQPFDSRDRATNCWPLAIISMGESWHNLHHADPTCARHGVDRGQLDSSAALIRVFERAGWATRVRWPSPERMDRRRR